MSLEAPWVHWNAFLVLVFWKFSWHKSINGSLGSIRISVIKFKTVEQDAYIYFEWNWFQSLALLFHTFTHNHKQQDVCVWSAQDSVCVCVRHRGQETVAPEFLGCLLGLSWSGTTNHNFDKLFYDPWESSCHGMTMISVLHFSSSLILRQGCCPPSLFSHTERLYCCLPVERKGMGHL